MGDVLKFVFVGFLILVVLALALPLLWLVIKLIGWLFGGALLLIGGDIFWIIFIIGCVIALIKMLAD